MSNLLISNEPKKWGHYFSLFSKSQANRRSIAEFLALLFNTFFRYPEENGLRKITESKIDLIRYLI